MPETRKLKIGDKVETVHGEKLVVEKVEDVIVKRKGVPTGDGQVRILAQSGGNPTWFPSSKLK